MRNLASADERDLRTTATVLVAGSEAASDVLSLAFGSDGKRLLIGCCGGLVVSCNARTGEAIETVLEAPQSNWIWSISVRADGAVAAASKDHCLWLSLPGASLERLDLPTLERRWIVPATDLFDTVFLPDGRLVAVGGDAEIFIVDLQTKSYKIIDAQDQKETFRTLCLTGTDHIVTGSSDGLLSLWDLGMSCRLASVKRNAGIETLVRISDSEILVGDAKGQIDRVTLEGFRTAQSYVGHSGAISHLALHPDGKRFASSSDDGSLRLWDLDNRASITTIPSPNGLGCAAARFDPAGERLVWASGANVYCVTVGELEKTQSEVGSCDKTRTFALGHTRAISAFAPLRNSGKLASVGLDGALCIWSLAEGRLLQRLTPHVDVINAVLDLGDGRVATGSRDETIVVSDLGAHTSICIAHKQKFDPGEVAGLWPGPNGTILSGVRLGHNDLHLWDSHSGKRQLFPRLEEAEQADIVAVVALPGGLEFISLDELGGVSTWKRNSKLASTWFGEGRGWCLAPDGSAAFIGDGPVQRVDVRTKQIGATIGIGSDLLRFALDPTGRYAAYQTTEHTTICDAQSGIVLGTVSGKSQSLAWSPTGRLLALASGKEVRLWSTELRAIADEVQASDDVAVLSLPEDGLVVAGGRMGIVQFFASTVTEVLDAKARELAAIEAKAREAEARERAALEAEAREAEAREAKAREAEARKLEAREAKAREAEARRAAAREAKAREEEARAAKKREVEAQRAAAREAKAREAQKREAEALKLEAREEKKRQTLARKAEARAERAREAQAAREAKALKKRASAAGKGRAAPRLQATLGKPRTSTAQFAKLTRRGSPSSAKSNIQKTPKVARGAKPLSVTSKKSKPLTPKAKKPVTSVKPQQAPSPRNKRAPAANSSQSRAALTTVGKRALLTSKPSKTKPSKTKPSKAKPSKAKPSKTKPSKTKPSKTKPSKTKPSKTKPSKAKPSKAKPSTPLSGNLRGSKKKSKKARAR